MSTAMRESRPQLRPMASGDLSAVMAVERAAYEFPWTEAIFRDCLRVGYRCLVYELGRQLVGHGVMSIGAGECHLLNICVHPDYQRRGLGRELVTTLMALARAERARLAFLEVRVSNKGAYRMYTQLGFHEIGTRKGYYPASRGREDALILARELEPATL